MIKIDHATFTYGENNEYSVGIRDIDLEIEDGQVIVLCGESGCGKTTLTRMINGLIPHYYEGKLTGEIWINGTRLTANHRYRSFTMCSRPNGIPFFTILQIKIILWLWCKFFFKYMCHLFFLLSTPVSHPPPVLSAQTVRKLPLPLYRLPC